MFVPAFVSYSASNENLVASVLPPITEKGVAAGWGANMMYPPLPFLGGQIPIGAPWFVKFANSTMIFSPNKIDIVLEGIFLENGGQESESLRTAVDYLLAVKKKCQLLDATRIAYAPTLGLDEDDSFSVDGYFDKLVSIPFMGGVSKTDFLLTMNHPMRKTFGNKQDIWVNFLFKINEGSRTQKETIGEGEEEIKQYRCVIMEMDINTKDGNINYSDDDVWGFYNNVLYWKEDLFNSLVNI